MNWRTFLVLIVVTGAARAASTTAPASPAYPATQPAEPGLAQVKSCGIQVGLAMKDEKSRPGMLFEPGVGLALYIHVAKGAIINYAREGSRVDEFSDDRGGDLLKTAPENAPYTIWREIGFGRNGKISKDATGILFSVESTALPATNANSLHARGTMVIDIAEGKKEFVSPPIALKEGTSVEVGGVKYQLKDVGKNDSIYPGFSVMFKTTSDDDDRVEDVSFRDENDKPIEFKFGMSATGAGESTRQVVFTAHPEKVKMVVSLWQNLRRVAIPFDVKAAIDLQ